jgi:hypothetical protein
MRLLRHLIATDLRRFRWVLAAWIAVVGAAVLANAVPSPGDYEPTGVSPIAIARSLLAFTQTILLLLIVPLVMHAHPAVGTNAFWMTRPLPVPTLVGSKFVLLLCVVMAPVTAAAAAMAGYDVAPRHIVLISVAAAIIYASVVLALMVLASWTPDLWRFALVNVGILAAIGGALTVTLMVAVRRMNETPTADLGGGSLNGGVLLTLYAATGLAVLVVQYRTRLRLRSVPLAIAGLLIAVVAAGNWPAEQPRPESPDWVDASLEVVPDIASIELQNGFSFGEQPQWRMVNAHLGLRGIPPGWSGSVTLADAALNLGGTVLTRTWSHSVAINTVVQGSGWISLAPDGSPQQMLRSLLDVGRILYPETEAPPKTTVFAVRNQEFSQHAPAVGHYSGRFWIVFARHDVEAVLPLQQGAVHRGDWYRFVLDGFEGGWRGITVLLRQSLAISGPEPPARFSFFVRNRERREAVEASTQYVQNDVLFQRVFPFSGFASTPSGGFGVYRLRVSIPPPYRLDRAAAEPTIDDEWLRGSELVILRSSPGGAVQRTVEIAEFPLREPRSARETDSRN